MPGAFGCWPCHPLPRSGCGPPEGTLGAVTGPEVAGPPAVVVDGAGASWGVRGLLLRDDGAGCCG
jgi:hypothetical protein